MARFSNVQLIQIIIKAARRVNRELCLFGETDEIVIDSTTGEITSPDDGTFEDLVLMQSECLLAQRDFASDLSSNQIGLSVKDGEQNLDNRQKGVARGTFFNSPYSPCALYSQEIIKEKLKRASSFDIW